MLYISEKASRKTWARLLAKIYEFEDIFFHILATNFMEGVFEIARHYRGKDWAENMMNLLIRQHLYGSSSFQKRNLYKLYFFCFNIEGFIKH